MLAGGESKTTNHKFYYWWPTEGDRRDFACYGRVGKWVGENSRVLDKKPIVDCVRLLSEQFPELSLIEARDFAGRAARWAK
jgi:hypothetical protein